MFSVKMGFFKVQILLLVHIAICYPLNDTRENVDCLMKKFGENDIVCVCNSEHCDYHIPDITKGKINVFTSTREGARYSKTIQELEDFSTTDNVIIIDSNKKYQTIIGWGGALTDSAGINVRSLPLKTGEELLRSYFAEGGSMYNLCRIPMGGTDFSTHGYSYNDGDEDEDLKNFALAPEDFQYKIPLLKFIQNTSTQKLKFFTAVWTAPKWMKKNNKYNGFNGYLKEKYYQTWANYFIKFLRAYKEQEINFWALSTGNEPSMFSAVSNINNVFWTADTVSLWIRQNLGPTMKNSEFSDVKILAIDDQRFYFPNYASKVMENNITRDYIDGFAVHWYEDFMVSPKVLSQTHEKFPEKFILATEASNGYKPLIDKHVQIGSWERGEAYVEDIIDDLNNWVTGWVDWNLALNLEGGPTYINNFVDSPILVNAESGEFYKQPMYYAIGHFSKFVPENSVRVDVSSDIKGLHVVGFVKPNGSEGNTVIVIINKAEQSTAVSIKDGKGFINLDVEAKSFTTIVY